VSNLSLSDTNLASLGDTQSTINGLDTAIQQINDQRSTLGATQNRLEFASSNLMNSVQNNSASMSTIRDADFAVEAADLARNQILTQSGTAMLAQANSLSQNVLSLIR
jgi:flagellin